MKKESYNKSTIISSLFWKFLERGGYQGVQLIVQLVLARLLSPDAFGTIAIVMVFIDISQVFIQGGFNTALIQKKDADELDFSSILWLSMFTAVGLYAVIFIFAPYIGNFYDNVELTSVLRVLSLILFPGAINSIQVAYISKNILFKYLFKASLVATMISGIMGITLAFAGFGVWALVAQQFCYYAINTSILWFTIDWRPKFEFSIDRTKVLFRFSRDILGSNLIYRVYMHLRTLVIGRVYSSGALGIYNRGEQIPRVLVNNLNGSIQSVMLPALSEYQGDIIKLKVIVKKSIKLSSFIVFPMMVGLFIISDNLIILILTEAWVEAIQYLQIFSLVYALWPIITLNQEPIRALGRSDIIMKTEILKRVIGILVILISVQFGMLYVAVGALIERIVEVVINAYPTSRLINYSLLEQIKDISPIILASIMMGIAVYSVNYFNLNLLITVLFQVIIGLVVYTSISYILKIDSIFEIISLIKQVTHKRRD